MATISRDTVRVEISAVDKTKGAFKSLTNGLNKTQKRAKVLQNTLGNLGGRRLLSGIRTVTRELQGLAGIGGVIGAGGIAGGLGLLAREGLIAGDNLAKVSDRLGVATEDLTKLQFAVSQTSEVTDKSFNIALQRMTRRLSEAENGNTGLQKRLQELGLTVDDFAGKSPDQAFLTLADAIQQVGDQNERVRLTFAFFDSEGVGLVTTLQKGSAAIRELGDEAESLGIVFDRIELGEIEKANDQFGKLQSVIKATGIAFAVDLAPRLQQLTVDILAWIKESGGIQAVIDNKVIPSIKGLIENVTSLTDTLLFIPRLFSDAFSGVLGIINSVQLNTLKAARTLNDVSLKLTFDEDKRLEKLREQVSLNSAIADLYQDRIEGSREENSVVQERPDPDPISFDFDRQGLQAKLGEIQSDILNGLSEIEIPEIPLASLTSDLQIETTNDAVESINSQTESISDAVDQQERVVTSKLRSVGALLGAGFRDLGSAFSDAPEESIAPAIQNAVDSIDTSIAAVELPQIKVPTLDTSGLQNRLKLLQDSFREFDISNFDAETGNIEQNVSRVVVEVGLLENAIKRAKDAGQDLNFGNSEQLISAAGNAASQVRQTLQARDEQISAITTQEAAEEEAAAKRALAERESTDAAAKIEVEKARIATEAAATKRAAKQKELDSIRAGLDEEFAIQLQAKSRLAQLSEIGQTINIDADVRSNIVEQIEAQRVQSLQALEDAQIKLRENAKSSALSLDVLNSISVDNVTDIRSTLAEITEAATQERVEINDAIKITAISDEQKREQIAKIDSTAAELKSRANQAFNNLQSDISFDAGRFDLLGSVNLEGITDLPATLQEITQAVRAEAAQIQEAVKIEAITPESAQEQTQRLSDLNTAIRQQAIEAASDARRELRSAVFNLSDLIEFDTTSFQTVEKGAEQINQLFRDRVKAANLSVVLTDQEKQKLINEASELAKAANEKLEVNVKINTVQSGLDNGASLLGSLGNLQQSGVADDSEQARQRAEEIKRVQEDLNAAIEAGNQAEVQSQQNKLNQLSALQAREQQIAKKRFEDYKKTQKAIAIVSTISAATQVFQETKGDLFARVAGMAAALAAGYAQVRSIDRQQFSGGSISGSSSAGGSSSGGNISNQQIASSANENINTTSRRSVQNIVVSGFQISVDQLEEIAKGLNENAADGGTEIRVVRAA